MAKQAKDLCIGNEVYRVQREKITKANVISISLNTKTNIIKIILNNEYKCTGNKEDYYLNGEYGSLYFTDYKKALEEQTKLRKTHFETLLANVEKANKELSEFVKEYSILK